MDEIQQLFEKIKTLRVAVIGDVMLDTYWWGSVERISPEAPVPVVSLSKKEYRIGGAANVALNTAALQAQTTLFSVTGNDEDATLLLKLLEENNISSNYIIRSNKRITTNKIRIISRNQQMMRLDAEVTEDITSAEEQQLLDNFKAYTQKEKPAVVIFEDYNKGVLTPSLIHAVIEVCKANNIITTVDPKRKNFFAYTGATIFKPNLKEVKEALNIVTDNLEPEALHQVHLQLHERLQHHISMITLSERGLFFQHENEGKIFPSHKRNIADVSGAGDTVIAAASLVFAATKNIALAADMANLAGGLVCEEVGTAAINKEKLLGKCNQLYSIDKKIFE